MESISSKQLESQIAELQLVHHGLAAVEHNKGCTVLKGFLNFEAFTDQHCAISDSFEVAITVSSEYPTDLPSVHELSSKIERDYAHAFEDGTLCLGVPIEQRRIFHEQPSLLGFVNRLLVPYFFGYCYYKKYGTHPFGEARHGSEGIVDHYMSSLNLSDEVKVLAVISYLKKHGYRGHHPCPCGSGEIVRKCHGLALRQLHELHTDLSLTHDFLDVLQVCAGKLEQG